MMFYWLLLFAVIVWGVWYANTYNVKGFLAEITNPADFLNHRFVLKNIAIHSKEFLNSTRKFFTKLFSY